VPFLLYPDNYDNQGETMEWNTELEKQTPTPKKKISNFRKAFLWTAIPIIVSTAIGLLGAMSQTAWVGFSIFGGIIALGLWGLAILLCIGFAIARKDQIALGILLWSWYRDFVSGVNICCL
jgi:hypothetical protein